MREITLRIAGTACLVDKRDERDNFVKRIVLPADRNPDMTKRHIPYVEFLKRDVEKGSNLIGPYTHGSGEIEYLRFELVQHVVELSTLAGQPELTVAHSYAEHVAKMTDVAKSLNRAPRNECFAKEPVRDLIAGFMDLHRGTLRAGLLQEFKTEFVTKNAPNDPVHEIHGAAWSELLIEVESPISVTFTNPLGAITVKLFETTDLITIGNFPISEILTPGMGDDVPEHFLLYYNLAEDYNKPQDPPLPRQHAGIDNACTNTNWP